MRTGWWVAAATAGFGAIYACSSPSSTGAPSTGDDAGDAQGELVDVGPSPACVTSPKPAPFPGGNGACNAPRPPQPDAVDEALAAVGSDRCSLSMGWAGKCVMPSPEAGELPDFAPLLAAPLRLPAYGGETAIWLDSAVNGATPVASSIAAAAARLGIPVSDCSDPAWFVVDGGDLAPLASALGELAAFYGDGSFDPSAAQSAVASLPLDLQQALVPVVRAIGYSAKDVDDARTPAKSAYAALGQTPAMIIGNPPPFDVTTAPLGAFGKVDVGKMARAATRVAATVESAQLARFAGRDVPGTAVDTPFGAIVVHGRAADTTLPGDKADGAALLLDTGGDDTYRVPVGTGTLARALAVAIDLGGNDLYAYVEKPVPSDMKGHRLPSDSAGRFGGPTVSRTPRHGAGVLGVGLLLDYGAGNDTYRSLAVSEGTGVLGVGVLFDDGGDDKYASETLSQGAAGWGIGLLLDRAGKDSYVVYNSAQGFGFAKGFGALVDEAGNDTYFSDPGEPSIGGDAIYPNGQLPGPPQSTLAGNTSMTQGAGEGFRPDVPFAGHPFPGGMGVLRDAAGDDSYTTSVFGQASAFAMGIGMLLEGGGDDVYEGLWYVQGSAAHTGLTTFADVAGNDRYDPTFPIQATSIGVGHDCSVSLHYDAGGDDAYRGPGLSLGAGNALGIGLLVNAGGTDTFAAGSPYAFGAAGWDYYPNESTSIGVFVKAGGASTYQVAGLSPDGGAGPAPGGTWSYSVHDAGMLEKGAGLDRPGGSAALP
ncbi:MAG TPA: hypothetical protein VIF15_04850 [Polyangiaceae bacterium]|jgi:hypothetical protein